MLIGIRRLRKTLLHCQPTDIILLVAHTLWSTRHEVVWEMEGRLKPRPLTAGTLWNTTPRTHTHTHTHTHTVFPLSLSISLCLSVLSACVSVSVSLSLSLCLSVSLCLYVCLSVCLSVSLCLCLSVCLSVCLSGSLTACLVSERMTLQKDRRSTKTRSGCLVDLVSPV